MNSTLAKPPVALLGLGLMGSGMARRLLSGGFPLAVYNRSPQKAAALAVDGAKLAPSPREAAVHASVIISMVADDTASRHLWLGEHGALGGAKPGTILVECSTVSVGWVKELAQAALAKGCELLDAPVTGSKVHAASGELCFLVGGSSEALEKARPVLQVMSRAIIHLGPSGSGAVLKLINNFLCGTQAAALAEALTWIERSGLDRTQALEIITNGAPGSPLVKLLSSRMTAQDYTPNFPLQLMTKDLAYSLQEARRHALSLSTAAAALEVFQQAVAAGEGGKDFSAVIEPFRHARTAAVSYAR